MPIRIALVDDDARLTKILKSDLLEFSEVDSVTTHHSGLSFAKEIEHLSLSKCPEIIIMDISMALPDEGIQATRLIKNKFPAIGIIMFTVSDEDERIFEAFKAGAMGYLLKNEPAEFIVKTILDVHNGEAQMSPSIARKSIEFLLSKSQLQSRTPTTDEMRMLSAREIEILEHIAKGSSYSQIADKLFISNNTVKKHMGNIFKKLQVRNKIEALVKVKG